MVPEERIAQLKEQNALLVAENTELKAVNEQLLARLEKLEAELHRHSGNSSKPPSSDTVAQRAAQNARRAKWKKKPKAQPGKQPGSKGKHLVPLADPDLVVRHVPAVCPACGAAMDQTPVVSVERRQVFDIPEPKVVVTEHLAERRRCTCGATAAATYLLVRQHLPVGRTAELLADVMGAPVSTGWLAGVPAEAAQGLEGFLADARGRLSRAPVLHVDETGARVSGSRRWLHVASTDLVTLLHCHDKRGVEATDALGVLPAFGGVAVHDRWKPYWRYGCTHAICGAHLLRDLGAVAEIPSQTAWAEAMATVLLEAKQAATRAAVAGDPAVDHHEREHLRHRYDEVVAQGIAANPTPIRWSGRTPLERQGYNLAVAVRDHKDEVLRFLDDLRVPFDNNQAERDLRMAKLQQKVSGCWRTPEGARSFCAVRSYISTAAKHGVHALDVLALLFAGSPWMIPPGSPT
ncbi:MAG: IS66 family transposase [Actinomycetota bacterium]